MRLTPQASVSSCVGGKQDLPQQRCPGNGDRAGLGQQKCQGLRNTQGAANSGLTCRSTNMTPSTPSDPVPKPSANAVSQVLAGLKGDRDT